MNRNNSGFTVIFWLILIFGFGGSLLSGLFTLLPIFIVLFIFSGLFKGAGSEDNRSYSRVRNSQSGDGGRYRSMSNRDLNRIYKKLNAYYKDNMKLAVCDGIALTTKNGNYTGVDDLYLTYDNELIISLAEFRNNYGDIYQRILELLLAFAKSDDTEVKESTQAKTVTPIKEVSKAQSYIDKISGLNIDINNAEVKNSLDQTCKLLKQIDLYAGEEDAERLSKLYDYYLPILTKILENYKELGKVSADSNEFKHNETQLLKTIVLINEALKEMNKSIHEDDYMNLSADITTLQSLLKKDGLVNGNPFKKEDTDDDGQE